MTEFEKKEPLSEKEENAFFWQLGFRLYSSVLRGHIMGHKQPMSSARDYLHFQSLEGMDREASEFLVDVANMGRAGGFTMEELHRKWAVAAEWHPAGGRETARMQVKVDEEYAKRCRQEDIEGVRCHKPDGHSGSHDNGNEKWG